MHEENPGRALSRHKPRWQRSELARDTYIIIGQAQRALGIALVDKNVQGHEQASRQRLCRFDNPARHRLGITGHDLAEYGVVILPGNAKDAIIGRLYLARERYRLLCGPAEAQRDHIPYIGDAQEPPCADPASYANEEHEYEDERNEYVDNGEQAMSPSLVMKTERTSNRYLYPPSKTHSLYSRSASDLSEIP